MCNDGWLDLRKSGLLAPPAQRPLLQLQPRARPHGCTHPCACPCVQIGLIAQDAESVVPEIFVTDPQGWKSVQYSKLIPVLIEALREQQDQIDSLELKLKQDNANLSRRLRALNA